jgi:hypothetical protein
MCLLSGEVHMLDSDGAHVDCPYSVSDDKYQTADTDCQFVSESVSVLS